MVRKKKLTLHQLVVSLYMIPLLSRFLLLLLLLLFVCLLLVFVVGFCCCFVVVFCTKRDSRQYTEKLHWYKDKFTRSKAVQRSVEFTTPQAFSSR